MRGGMPWVFGTLCPGHPLHRRSAVNAAEADVYKRQPPGGRQLAKIPLLVIDLPASADAFAKGIINPLDGAFGVPVADIGPHGIVALVEGLDAIEVAVALPHREDRSPEGLADCLLYTSRCV